MFIPNPHPGQPAQHSQPGPIQNGPEPVMFTAQQQPYPQHHNVATGVNPAYHDKHIQPTPVVKVLSPFGVEYVFLTIALLTGAVSVIGILLSMIEGNFSLSILAFPLSVLLVSLPLFYFLFMRLKKLELQYPQLKFDASKRRSTQFIQIVTFLASLITLIAFVFNVIMMIGGHGGNFFKTFFSCLAIVAVSGGILAYFWLEEHKG